MMLKTLKNGMEKKDDDGDDGGACYLIVMLKPDCGMK